MGPAIPGLAFVARVRAKAFSMDADSESEFKEARLSTIDGRATIGRFEIVTLTVAQRFKSAFKWLAIFWIAALPFIPIPFIHLFIPGPLLIAGMIAFVRMGRITQRIRAGVAPCPACGGDVSLAGDSFREHFKENCAKCNFGLKVDF
jgi:hypothetical protein